MIRPFRSEDASSCCQLIQTCLESDVSFSYALREKMHSAETPQTMIERAGLFYVAVYESGERILGVAGLDMNEIRLLCVSPETRRHGIGRALLEHFKTMVPDILFPDIFVYSSIQAVGFYQACGFIERGPFSFDVGGESVPTVFMTLGTHPSRA
jgi:N-acetylglutamate synthase-like GNAT family acetyltransferase